MNKDFFIEALNQQENSCDPNTRVGCVIVKDDKIVSTGYNTLACGLNPDNYPLDCREGCFLETKYPYILHSEAKAIINAKQDLSGASIYVTLFPCNECAKLIIEAQIKKIYYLDDKYADEDHVIASKKMLQEGNVHYEQINL